MLVCLIAIPLAALFGTKLPDLTKGLLQKEWDLAFLDQEWDLSELWGRDTAAEAPPFGPSVSAAPWGDRPGSGNLGGIPTHWQASAPADPRRRLPRQPGDQRPIDGTSPRGPSEEPAGTTLTNDPNPPRLVPVGMPGQEAGSATRAAYVAPAGGRQGSEVTPESLRTNRDAVHVQRRLRALGAAYYALETWGAQGRLFRFHARMPVSGTAGGLRHFEAVDAHPVRAMCEVLAQVERRQAR